MKCFINLVSPNSDVCKVSLDTYIVDGHKLTEVQFNALKISLNGRLNAIHLAFNGIQHSDIDLLIQLGMIEKKEDIRGKIFYNVSNEELKEHVKTIERKLQTLTSVKLAKEWCVLNEYEPVIFKSSIYSMLESVHKISNDTIE